MPEFALVDVSNTFTKIAFSSRSRLGRVLRLPTAQLTPARLRQTLSPVGVKHVVVASVVPDRNAALETFFGSKICWVGAGIPLGVGIDYPHPETIGADRLANAVAARELYGTPSIVVDFGTAVTFDVISAEGSYVGGVIAPGLNSLTEYLHQRTALLPRITLKEPRQAIGRSTKEAMLSGAVHGYRGLISGIVQEIMKEIPGKKRPVLVATGGDARLIAQGTDLFAAVAPSLTLDGLRLIGARNFPVRGVGDL